MNCRLRTSPDVVLDNARKKLNEIDALVCKAVVPAAKVGRHQSITALANRRFRRADSIMKAKIHQAEAKQETIIPIIRLKRTNEVLRRVNTWVTENCKALGEEVTTAAQKLANRLMERLVGESIFEQRRLLEKDSRFKEDTSCFAEVREQSRATGRSLNWLFTNEEIIKHIDSAQGEDDKSFAVLAPLTERMQDRLSH